MMKIFMRNSIHAFGSTSCSKKNNKDKHMKRTGILFFLIFGAISAFAQNTYWQQRVKYVMDVDMNVETNRLSGRQKLEYWNNSPDTLKKVFYHLYWNAFQPGSMMDERSRRQGKILINGKPDWDPR